ncbi:MAG: radical SAM protein [Deltaproteobacteria bacterium]|nr:radical SAM protein [Deltaproteobacteria bacterium]
MIDIYMDQLQEYENCRLCPRSCGVNRLSVNSEAPLGFCGETDQLKVAYVGPHFGEEPPISGTRGSGTVFFTGCSLRCSFCQNHQISHGGTGKRVRLSELLENVEKMIAHLHVHNINFVTPDHFFPHLVRLVNSLGKKGFDLPVVYNLSGYQSLEMLNAAEDCVDIFLSDFKYADSSLAAGLSKCRDYPQVAIEAIAEMVRQKGFLDPCSNGSDVAKKGTLVRHLILPGYVQNSINALTTLFLEFGPQLPVSLMSQYHPVVLHEDHDLNRFICGDEFDRVYSHAMALGFERLFIQFPEKSAQPSMKASPFLPDFRREHPFGI